MPKLSDRKIVALHQLHAHGASNLDIARALDVHRNTVTAHLKLRVAYTRTVHKKIGANADLAPLNNISIYDAAAYLPGFPSRDVVYRLHRQGVLAAMLNAGRLVTTEAKVRRAANRMLPPGLWFNTRLIANYCFEPASLLEGLPMTDCRFWPSKEYRYVSAVDVTRKAAELGVTLQVPAAVRRRAVRCMELFDVATV